MIIIDCYVIPNRILIPESIHSSHCVRLKKQENCIESCCIGLMFIGPGRTCAPTNGYFHDKTKISTANLRVDYCLLLKYCRSQYTFASPTWAKLHTNLSLKCEIINVFWA